MQTLHWVLARWENLERPLQVRKRIRQEVTRILKYIRGGTAETGIAPQSQTRRVEKLEMHGGGSDHGETNGGHALPLAPTRRQAPRASTAEVPLQEA